MACGVRRMHVGMWRAPGARGMPVPRGRVRGLPPGFVRARVNVQHGVRVRLTASSVACRWGASRQATPDISLSGPRTSASRTMVAHPSTSPRGRRPALCTSGGMAMAGLRLYLQASRGASHATLTTPSRRDRGRRSAAPHASLTIPLLAARGVRCLSIAPLRPALVGARLPLLPRSHLRSRIHVGGALRPCSNKSRAMVRAMQLAGTVYGQNVCAVTGSAQCMVEAVDNDG